MLFSLILASLLVTPSPQPAPPTTQLPVIFHGTVSPVCQTLNGLMLPVGYVTRHNDAAFYAMASSLRMFAQHFMPGDAPSPQDMAAALGGWSGSAAATNGTGTPLTTSASSSIHDDQTLFGPSQTINAARIDAVAQQVYANLRLERDYLSKSLAAYPPNSLDPHIDALRKRVENVITLQQALADRYEQFAGTYIDSMGLTGMTTVSASDRAQLDVALRGLILGQAGALAEPNDEMSSFSSVADVAERGTPGQVLTATRDAELEFSKTLLATYDTCNGTHHKVTVVKP